MNFHSPDNEDPFSSLQQRWEALKDENRALKQQLAQAQQQLAQTQQELADLRRGVGITVLVGGKPVATGNSGIGPDVAPPMPPGPQPYAAPAFLGERRQVPPNGAPFPGPQRPGAAPNGRDPYSGKPGEYSQNASLFLE